MGNELEDKTAEQNDLSARVAEEAKGFSDRVSGAIKERNEAGLRGNAAYMGAGVGFYNAVQQFRTSDMGEAAQRDFADAGQQFADAWAEAHGMQPGQVRAQMTFDRNGEPHVRLYQGEDNFPVNYSYEKMEEHLRKNGYLDETDKALKGQLGIAESAPAAPEQQAAGKPAKYSDPIGDLLEYAGKMPPGARAMIVERGIKQLGLGDEDANMLRSALSGENFWETPKAAAGSGGKASSGGGGGGTAGDLLGGDAGPAPTEEEMTNAVMGGEWGKHLSQPAAGGEQGKGSGGSADDLLSGKSGQPPAQNPASTNSSALEEAVNKGLQAMDDFVAGKRTLDGKPVETPTEEPPKGAAGEGAGAEGGAAAAKPDEKPAEPEPYMVGQANLRDEKQLAKVEANLKKQGFVVREINGEHYMWHPKAKVWMASDGHTVVERNGTFVDSGVAKGKLHWVDEGRKILKANGPGGQGDVKETVLPGQEHNEDVPQDFIKYLQFKNAANGGFSDDPGDDDESSSRTEARVSAVESGPNGEKGSLTIARRFNNLVGEKERATVKDEDGKIDPVSTFNNTMAIQKDLIAQFDALPDKEKRRALSNLDDYGRSEFFAAQNIVRADAVFNEIANAKGAAGIIAAIEKTIGPLSDEDKEKLQDAEAADLLALQKDKAFEERMKRLAKRKAKFRRSMNASAEEDDDPQLASEIASAWAEKHHAKMRSWSENGVPASGKAENGRAPKIRRINLRSDGTADPLEREKIKRKYGIDVDATA